MLFHLVTRRGVDNRTADPRSGRRPQLLTAQRPHHWEFLLVSSCLHLLYYSHFHKFNSSLDLINVLSKWSHRPTSESQESQQILSGRSKGVNRLITLTAPDLGTVQVCQQLYSAVISPLNPSIALDHDRA